MRGLLVVLMLGILFLSACSPAQQITTEKVTCDPPLIKAGNGCCLDENSNYICDKDEIEEVGYWFEVHWKYELTHEPSLPQFV